MTCKQRPLGGQVTWRCKPRRFRLSETKLMCLPSSCRHAGRRLHGCAAGCASCSKIHMLGLAQLPEQLLCHPAIRSKGRLCSSASRFTPTYVRHLLLRKINLPPLQLHICWANETSAASTLHKDHPKELAFAQCLNSTLLLDGQPSVCSDCRSGTLQLLCS